MNIKIITKKNFHKYYNLLEKDFCWEERRSEIDEKQELNNSAFNVAFIEEDLQEVGYVSYYEFNNYIFIEHFAIFENLRDKGYGGKFLSWFINNISKNLILEVELPENLIAQKRIKFYERLGLGVNNQKYVQPSYHEEDDGLEMRIMSLKPLSDEEFKEVVNILYSNVYKISSAKQFEK